LSDLDSVVSLTVEHLRIISALQRLAPIPEFHETPRAHQFEVALTDLYRELSRKKNKNLIQKVSTILTDLENCWIRLETPTEVRVFRILVTASLKESKDEDNRKTKIGIIFTEEFCHLINTTLQLQVLEFGELKQITSDIAAAIYVTLPSRCITRTKDNPYTVPVNELLADVGHPDGRNIKPWLASQIFTQNKNSVLNQLNGRFVSKNRVLRVELSSAGFGEYARLVAYTVDPCEESKHSDTPALGEINKNSKLYTTWAKAGGSDVVYADRLSRTPTNLDEYELGVLTMIGFSNIDQSLKFLCMVKALIGRSVFTETLGELKSSINERRIGVIDNINGYVVGMFMEQVSGAGSEDAFAVAAREFESSKD